MSESVYKRYGQRDRTGLAVAIGADLETVAYFQHQVAGMVFVLEAEMGQETKQLCHTGRHYLGDRHFDVDVVDPVLSINPAMLSNRTEIGTISVPPFYGRGFQGINANTGSIVIFDAPVEFTVQTTLSMLDLKRITALKGTVREGQWHNTTHELYSGGIVENSWVSQGGSSTACQVSHATLTGSMTQ